MASTARGKALVAKLRANPKVRDPEALAAWLGRVKRLKRGGLSTKAAMKAADGSKSSNGAGKSGSIKPGTRVRMVVDGEDKGTGTIKRTNVPGNMTRHEVDFDKPETLRIGKTMGVRSTALVQPKHLRVIGKDSSGGLSTKAAMKAAKGGDSRNSSSSPSKSKKSMSRFTADDVQFGKPATYSGEQRIEVKADLGGGFPQTIAQLKRRKGEKQWRIDYGGKSFTQPPEQNLSFIKKKLAQKLADDEKKGELQTSRARSSSTTLNPVKSTSRSAQERTRDPKTISDAELPLVLQFAKTNNPAFYQKLLAEKRRREKRKK